MPLHAQLKIVKTTYTNVSHKDEPSLAVECFSSYVSLAQDRATAVAKFADFWAAHKDGECRSRFVAFLTAGVSGYSEGAQGPSMFPNLAVDWLGLGLSGWCG